MLQSHKNVLQIIWNESSWIGYAPGVLLRLETGDEKLLSKAKESSRWSLFASFSRIDSLSCFDLASCSSSARTLPSLKRAGEPSVRGERSDNFCFSSRFSLFSSALTFCSLEHLRCSSSSLALASLAPKMSNAATRATGVASCARAAFSFAAFVSSNS